MKSLQYSMPQFLLVALMILSLSWATSADTHDEFLQCLTSLHPEESSSISNVTYTQTNSSYSSVLEASIRNLRFNTSTTPKPLVIVTPLNASHVQSTIHCAREHGLQIRTRSGGHDFEGLSYVSQVPFVVVDLINYRSVDVDVENRVVWVQTGATTGELNYKIAEKSRTLAFPTALCQTVGIGGFVSGGGYGLLFRKYGLVADNVIDAQFVGVDGRIHDRKSMGEDLFWAIRGGGGGSFGIVLAWKINLVPVPENVTIFSVTKTLAQNATKLLHRWQYVAPNLPNDLYSTVAVSTTNTTQDGNRTVVATFRGLFQGGVNELIPMMQERFPELGLVEEDCTEASWIESLVLWNQLPNETLDILLDRSASAASPAFKAKSDYVQKPIPEIGLQGIWSQLLEEDGRVGSLIFISYGGKMDEIPETALPFPHRRGNLYKMNYITGWEAEDTNAERYISWIRKLYSYTSSYVSKSPRQAYINYRDLDIGMNNIEGDTSYEQASVWGRRYFKNNFDRLLHVKTKVDPENFFRHEQSIPSLMS